MGKHMRVFAALCLPMLCAGTTAGGHAVRGRPAVRRAGNLVTTAGAAQLRGLTVAFRRPPLMDPYCARGAGGLSTLLLLLPGLVARRRGDARRARWFGIQTAIAFISDYVMIGALSICHGIDRLCASYTFASLTLRAYRGRPTPPQRSAPQQGAPAGEAPRARPRLVRVGCLAAGVPAVWCKARAAEAAQRGEARCEPSSVAPEPWRPGEGVVEPGHGPGCDGAVAASIPPHWAPTHAPTPFCCFVRDGSFSHAGDAAAWDAWHTLWHVASAQAAMIVEGHA